MTELSVAVDARPDRTVLAARGKILFDTRQPLDEPLRKALAGPHPRIVIDLHEVVMCDSSGLQLLVDAHRQATAAGGTLRLCRPQPFVQRVLDITNLTRILAVYESVEAAVSAPG
jgi:anti-anti-sigma factor